MIILRKYHEIRRLFLTVYLFRKEQDKSRRRLQNQALILSGKLKLNQVMQPEFSDPLGN
jgi:hypothetical protein